MNFCSNCYNKITDTSNKKRFETCKNHFYCNNCFSSLKNRKCQECNLEAFKYPKVCDFCKQRVSLSNLCESHKICDYCLKRLKLESGNIVVDLLYCNKCKDIIQRQKEKYLNEANKSIKDLIINNANIQKNEFQAPDLNQPSSTKYLDYGYSPQINSLITTFIK